MEVALDSRQTYHEFGSTTHNASPNSTTTQRITKTEPDAAPGVASPNPSANMSSISASTRMTTMPESLATEKQDSAQTAPQPPVENVNGSAGRQLSVKGALSYLDAVKDQFHDRPDGYNLFLDIMKDFKNQV